MDKIVSIDIIISCYNVEQTIEKCIMSLCSQSYPKNKYHCYFVNDASTDKTGEILDNFRGEKNKSQPAFAWCSLCRVDSNDTVGYYVDPSNPKIVLDYVPKIKTEEEVPF